MQLNNFTHRRGRGIKHKQDDAERTIEFKDKNGRVVMINTIDVLNTFT